MRLLILSRRSTLYSTRRLLEAAATLGNEGVVVDPLECWLTCGRREPAIYYGASRHKVAGFDVVLPRIGSSITDYGLAVVNQFDMLGVPVVNMAYAIGRSRDKLRSLQFLSRHDIDMLESRGGPKVIEVNSSPGFEGLERATGIDVARAMVEYATSYASSRAEPARQVR